MIFEPLDFLAGLAALVSNPGVNPLRTGYKYRSDFTSAQFGNELQRSVDLHAAPLTVTRKQHFAANPVRSDIHEFPV